MIGDEKLEIGTKSVKSYVKWLMWGWYEMIWYDWSGMDVIMNYQIN